MIIAIRVLIAVLVLCATSLGSIAYWESIRPAPQIVIVNRGPCLVAAVTEGAFADLRGYCRHGQYVVAK